MGLLEMKPTRRIVLSEKSYTPGKDSSRPDGSMKSKRYPYHIINFCLSV